MAAKFPVEDSKLLKAVNTANTTAQRIVQTLNRISGQLEQLNRNLTESTETLIALEHEQMATYAEEFQRTQDEIAQNSDAIDSATTVLNQLSQLIRDNATDPDALAALADELDANTERLAAAVAANTPAGEPTPEEPA